MARRGGKIGQPQPRHGDLGETADMQHPFGRQRGKGGRAIRDHDIQDVILDDRQIMPPRQLGQFAPAVGPHLAGQRIDDIGLQIDRPDQAAPRHLVQCGGQHSLRIHRHAFQMQAKIAAQRHQRVMGQRLCGNARTGRHHPHQCGGDGGRGAIGDGDILRLGRDADPVQPVCRGGTVLRQHGIGPERQGRSRSQMFGQPAKALPQPLQMQGFGHGFQDRQIHHLARAFGQIGLSRLGPRPQNERPAPHLARNQAPADQLFIGAADGLHRKPQIIGQFPMRHQTRPHRQRAGFDGAGELFRQ